MPKKQRRRGRSPDESLSEIFDIMYYKEEVARLQERLDESERIIVAMQTKHEEEKKNIQADHEQKMLAFQVYHNGVLKATLEDHDLYVEAMRFAHEKQKQYLRNNIDLMEQDLQGNQEAACEKLKEKLLTIVISHAITLGADAATHVEIVLRRTVENTAKYAAHFKILAEYIANPQVFILNFHQTVGIVAPGGHIDINLLLKHYGEEQEGNAQV